MSWKKQYKSELDKKIERLDEKILSTEQRAQLVASGAGANASFITSKKGIVTTVSVALALIIMVSLILSFSLIKPPLKFPTTFSIEINPAAAFVVDKDDRVTKVTAINQDADLILSNDDNVKLIVGKSADQAATAFVDLAIKYGFISRDKDLAAVRFSSTEKDRFSIAVKATETYLLDKGFYAMVFDQKLTETEFLTLLGVEKEDKTSLEDTLLHAPTLFTERAAAGKDNKELTDIYVNDLTTGLSFIADIRAKLLEYDSIVAFVISNMLDDWETIINGLLPIYQFFELDGLNAYLEKTLENLTKQSEILIETAKTDYLATANKITAKDNGEYLNELLDGKSYGEFWAAQNN